jgi:hypothetical protein
MVQADGMGRAGTCALLEHRRTVSMTESNRILVHRVGDHRQRSAKPVVIHIMKTVTFFMDNDDYP